ncbi:MULTISPECIES: hypothetical protein [unclassified Rhizobium]|uniref:hypothetical protein n=1 Tax=unclassified Rhizobium TaxID=2613769 RepID=UPI0006466129|nr:MULTISPECIES: hypothetical protein [unclassified Rhizobium]MBN8954098.1 hypothetical protein [Rhizobium tropici]OJY75894.1 MAG: hypothetical protein BGP09_19465 [Rhizobium sp. 60-20]RKD52370.1 hypothetical protein BJ928_11594 [Rhizobium sp. WW_1]
MKHFASFALSAALAVGAVLCATLPATSATLGSSPSSSVSNIILVQEHGTRRYPNDDGRAYWRDRDRDHRYWREHRWERRHWDDRWRDDRRYHHRHHGGVTFEIRP